MLIEQLELFEAYFLQFINQILNKSILAKKNARIKPV